MITTAELRSGLMKDLADFRSGKIGREDARIRANLAKHVIDALKLEMLSGPLSAEYLQPPTLEAAAEQRA